MTWKNGDVVVKWGPLTMTISDRKQDMHWKDGDGVINWGLYTMAIFNRKQDSHRKMGIGWSIRVLLR